MPLARRVHKASPAKQVRPDLLGQRALLAQRVTLEIQDRKAR